MMSRGSVIPVFINQVLTGQPLTVTDPGMTRFLMSLEESVELVEYAFANAQAGDLFVKKAPACTVGDLARAVAEVFGVTEPEIRVLGTRHSEKLFESLMSREEATKAEDRGEYFRVPLDARALEYELFFDEGEQALASGEDYTSHNTIRLDVEGVKHVLRALPPVRLALERAGLTSPGAP
jgi:UDP-N-acetylglucosamine 4,6-dehydratase/5-epimerase